jgi:preprotein translocase subunit Sss1
MTLDTAWERWDRKPTRANLKQVMKAALKETEEPQSHIEKLKELLVKIKRPDPK